MTIRNALLLFAAAVLFVIPLLVVQPGSGDFPGTDNQATDVIATIDSDYKPWFSYIWKPGIVTENLLFTLQAAIGAGIVAYCLGYLHGKRKREKKAGDDDTD